MRYLTNKLFDSSDEEFVERTNRAAATKQEEVDEDEDESIEARLEALKQQSKQQPATSKNVRYA